MTKLRALTNVPYMIRASQNWASPDHICRDGGPQYSWPTRDLGDEKARERLPHQAAISVPISAGFALLTLAFWGQQSRSVNVGEGDVHANDPIAPHLDYLLSWRTE